MELNTCNLKKSLCKLPHLQVLEIIGISKEPLSSTEVSKIWGMNYCPYRKTDKPSVNYVFEIIKDLYKPRHHLHHSERFLSISYKESVQKRLSFLENKFDRRVGERKETENGYIITVRTIRCKAEADDDFERSKADSERQAIMSNHRNWRYRLNFKGLLLYLIDVHYNNKDPKRQDKDMKAISNKTVDNVFENFVTRQDNKDYFKFLQYFDVLGKVYGIRKKNTALIDIALEMQNLLTLLAPESLRYYFMRRCYDEIASSYALKGNTFLNRLSGKNPDKQILDTLREYKLNILKDLIVEEENTLKNMKRDLKITSQTIL